MNHQPGSFPENAIYDAPYKDLSDLPLGTWNLLAAGRIYRLEVSSGPGNTYSIDWPGTPTRDVRWTPSTGKLSFVRVLPDKGEQQYTGYLLDRSHADPLWRLAGTFEQPNLSASSGWYGTRPVQ